MTPAPMKVDEEHLLVGAMLLDEDQRMLVRQRGINRHVIQQPNLAAIVEGMAKMDEVGYTLDVVVLARHLTSEGHEISVDFLTDLQALTMNRGSVDNALYYADMVIENYRTVKAWNAAAEVISTLRTNPDADIQAELTMALKVMQPDYDPPRGGWYADILPPYLDHLTARWRGEAEQEYVATPSERLNRILRGGFYNGESIIVGARPGIGKTVFGLWLAHGAAKQGRRVAFFSAEMTARAMLRRAGSEFTGVPANLIDIPRPLSDQGQESIRQGYLRSLQRDLAQLPVYVDDKSSPTVQYIDDSIRRLGDIGMVVIDYIGLMGEKAKSQVEKMDTISLGIQRLAKDHNIPVVGLSQLSRSVEAPTNKPYRPAMSHLRDSGQIEANAHVVLLLYRKMYYVHQQMLEGNIGDADTMQVIVSKNRESDTGVVPLRFDGATYQLKDTD